MEPVYSRTLASGFNSSILSGTIAKFKLVSSLPTLFGIFNFDITHIDTEFSDTVHTLSVSPSFPAVLSAYVSFELNLYRIAQPLLKSWYPG